MIRADVPPAGRRASKGRIPEDQAALALCSGKCLMLSAPIAALTRRCRFAPAAIGRCTAANALADIIIANLKLPCQQGSFFDGRPVLCKPLKFRADCGHFSFSRRQRSSAGKAAKAL